MSVLKNCVLVFISLCITCSFVKCTEFIPVYIWGTQKTSEHVPALHKISQDSFKDDILERLKGDPLIVVFAEQTLSPEDFAQRDQSGDIAYPHLSKLKKSSKVTYFPYVQSPIKALKHLNEDVTEISIEKLHNQWELPTSKIVIIDLNDAKDEEQRFDMLKRHDADIISIYNEIMKKHSNILALYTAHHISWVGAEEIASRRTRSLLAAADEDSSNKLFGEHIFVYLSGPANYTKGENSQNVSLAFTETTNDTAVILTGTGTEGSIALVIKFEFTKTDANYWQMDKVTVTNGGTEEIQIKSSKTIYAPVKFSYHCGDQVFKNENTSTVILPGFQVEPIYFRTHLTNSSKFDDPYDCVGFTTVPIWSGLFITFILLLIMTFGLTMMMDIKTMDRFDDAKGKTITINASE